MCKWKNSDVATVTKGTKHIAVVQVRTSTRLISATVAKINPYLIVQILSQSPLHWMIVNQDGTTEQLLRKRG